MKVSIFGASGYTGGELLRILINHRDIELSFLTSREYAGKPIHLAHPHLKGLLNSKFSSTSEAMKGDYDLAFLSLPPGNSKDITPKLLEVGIKVIDLSPDFRLKYPELYERWYGWKHPLPDLLDRSVYGIPEFNRDEIKRSSLVAVPGCNATSTLLASAPLTSLGANLLIADLKVGSSEAGSKPSKGSHHPERSQTIRPYSPSGHRHQAEVEQELKRFNPSIKVSIIPHSVGAVRGSFASVHAIIDADEGALWREFAKLYSNEPFIRIMPRGVFPDVKNVIGSNFADLGFSSDEESGRVTGFAAIDNLGKGAAGQAVQCMNLMLGFRETEALLIPPLRP